MGIVNLWESERNWEREASGSFDKEKRRKFKQNTSNFKTQTKRLKISRVWNIYSEPIAKRPETCATCQHNRFNSIWILGLFPYWGLGVKLKIHLHFQGGRFGFSALTMGESYHRSLHRTRRFGGLICRWPGPASPVLGGGGAARSGSHAFTFTPS